MPPPPSASSSVGTESNNNYRIIIIFRMAKFRLRVQIRRRILGQGKREARSLCLSFSRERKISTGCFPVNFTNRRGYYDRMTRLHHVYCTQYTIPPTSISKFRFEDHFSSFLPFKILRVLQTLDDDVFLL